MKFLNTFKITDFQEFKTNFSFEKLAHMRNFNLYIMESPSFTLIDLMFIKQVMEWNP